MLQAAIREGQQRSIEGALGVLQYGVVLVDVLHDFRVELVLLKKNKKTLKLKNFHNKLTHCRKNLGTKSVCVCVRGDREVDPTLVRIQLWRVSKRRKGQLMTRQTTLA